MALPHFEVPAGAIDGANVVFVVSVPYKPGSTAVFRNGLLQEKSLDDGWYESDPSMGEITLKEAPRGTPTGFPDVLQVFFLDMAPPLPETVVEHLCGRLRALDDLTGRLASQVLLQASLDVLGDLAGHLVSEPSLHGMVDVTEVLQGRLECICGG